MSSLTKPTCFLIMPISGSRVAGRTVPREDWTFLMQQVIAPIVDELGFEVVRADSVNKTGSIIRDIVAYIASADLAIVDLSGLNPNVLYELGVRHAVSNRTILLTQDLASLPFDLRDLRTIEYSLKTDGPDRLRDDLRKLVAAVMQAPADEADNPVLEYLKREPPGFLQDRLAAAATYQSYIESDEEAGDREASEATALAEKLNADLVDVPQGAVVSGLKAYEIGEIANLFNVTSKALHQRKEMVLELGAFQIMRFPVTNAQYWLFVADTLTRPPDDWRDGRYHPLTHRAHPVTGVAFEEASAFCRWLSQKTGVAYRLPTEVEWEMAARGSLEIHYPWGDQISAQHCNTELADASGTVPVFTYGDFASQSRVVDMSGNAWEWCMPYPVASDAPLGEDTGILKGGSWESSIFEAKVGYREVFKKTRAHHTIGFRCCVSE